MPIPPLIVLLGLLLAGAGLLVARASGAELSLGRRLAGAEEVPVGEIGDLDALPERAVRVVGRIRCADPLVTPDDDRLVAFHRDVEVEFERGGWCNIERVRETRSFELWDHDGSLSLDPAGAAEPLVAIPHVWRGSPEELDATHRSAVSRLSERLGPPRRARAATRMVSVVERLLILARVERDDEGAPRLAPPPGGYVISALELDAALRLLGGRRRSLLLIGSAAAVVGAAVALAGVVLVAIGG